MLTFRFTNGQVLTKDEGRVLANALSNGVVRFSKILANRIEIEVIHDDHGNREFVESVDKENEAAGHSTSQLMSEKEAAEYLGYTRRAMQNWRQNGKGAKYIQISKRAVRYRKSELDSWLKSKERTQTDGEMRPKEKPVNKPKTKRGKKNGRTRNLRTK